MAKLDTHRVVLLGEAHWVRHDAQLVASLVPRLADRNVVLAMETVPASEQAAVDRLLSAPVWDAAAAMRVMRAAAWPWREYLEILRAAWEANRKSPGALRLVALGPGDDWRETLLKSKGMTYDQFMADLVLAETSKRRRVLVYCGIHHAFTRYQQPELDVEGRATKFMDRTGNILRRNLGQRVFLITLHRPVWRGKEPWTYGLPQGGAIDCLAAGNGAPVGPVGPLRDPFGIPVGFDVAGTPIGDSLVEKDVYYAHGYAALRFGEMTDGYVWTRPIEDYKDVSLIPLAEFAPDEAALLEVASHNPFAGEKGLDAGKLRELWDAEARRRADVLASRRWNGLTGWRESCK